MEKTLNKILENALNNDELIKGRDKHTWECGYLKGLVIGLAEKFPEVAETLEKRLEFQEEKNLQKVIKKRMSDALRTEGGTFFWNPRSRYHKKFKIIGTTLTPKGNIKVTLNKPLKTKHDEPARKFFVIEPTLDCMERYCIRKVDIENGIRIHC